MVADSAALAMDDKSSKMAAARKRLDEFRKKKSTSNESAADGDSAIVKPKKSQVSDNSAFTQHTPVASTADPVHPVASSQALRSSANVRHNGPSMPLSPVAEASPIAPRRDISAGRPVVASTVNAQKSLWGSMPDINRGAAPRAYGSGDVVPLASMDRQDVVPSSVGVNGGVPQLRLSGDLALQPVTSTGIARVGSYTHVGAPASSSYVPIDRSLSASDLQQVGRSAPLAHANGGSAAGMSSTDRLRQLTQRLNNLAADTRVVTPTGRTSPAPSPSPSASESVLVSKIQQLSVERDQLKRALDELQRVHASQPTTSSNAVTQLQRQVDSLQSHMQQMGVRADADRRALEQQLRIHTQTIDILVEEKNELSSREKSVLARIAEADRLSTQLRAELDAERKRSSALASASSNGAGSASASAMHALEGEVAKLKVRVGELSGQLTVAADERQRALARADDASQAADELRLKLVTAVGEGESLRKRNVELEGKLDAADAIMRQLGHWDRAGHATLGGGDDGEGGNIRSAGVAGASGVAGEGSRTAGGPMDLAEGMRRLTSERQELHAQLAQAQHTSEQLKAEKREVTAHWKAANERMTVASKQLSEAQQRLASLESQLATAVDEREEAFRRTAESKTVAEGLQKELDALSTTRRALEDQVALVLASAAHASDSQAKEADGLREEMEQLRAQVAGLEGALAEQAERARRFGEQASDKEGILSRARADADTISRATTQNRELKERLVLLEDKFIEMTNANAELTDKLYSANHVLNAERRKREEAEVARNAAESLVETLTAQVSETRREMEEHRGDKQLHKHASGHAGDEELHAPPNGDRTLSRVTSSDSGAGSIEVAEDANAAEIARLSMLLDDHKRQLEAQRRLSESLQKELLLETHRATSGQTTATAIATGRSQATGTTTLQTTGEGAAADKETVGVGRSGEDQEDHTLAMIAELKAENVRLRDAIDALGVRLSALLEERQALIDRVETEEHLNVQLSGEVETIGEYISLYHQERRALRERAVQKDALVAQLALSRDEMQEKCGELKSLVLRLLAERDGSAAHRVEGKADGDTAETQSSAAAPVDGGAALNNSEGANVRQALEKLEGPRLPRHGESVVNILESIKFDAPAIEFKPCARCSSRMYRV